MGIATILLIGAPTLVVEEDWHGRPMLDQGGHLWVIPTLVVAAAFALGGVLAARGTPRLGDAAARGLVAGVAAAAVFLGADAVRRALRNQAVSPAVARLWVLATVLSVVIAGLAAASAHALRRSPDGGSPNQPPSSPP